MTCWCQGISIRGIDIFIPEVCVVAPKELIFFNTLRPEQNGLCFAYNVFKCISLNENIFSLKFHCSLHLKSPINNESALVQVMAWCVKQQHYMRQCWPSFTLPSPRTNKLIDWNFVIRVWWGVAEWPEVRPPTGNYSTAIAFKRDAFQQKQKLWYHLGNAWRHLFFYHY